VTFARYDLIQLVVFLLTHERVVDKAGEEKCRLVCQLPEAFNYIGTVNVEIQEIQSIFCGVERYRQTNREIKRFVDRLTAKVMTVSGTPLKLLF
jgi:hypothetical protein